MENEKNEVFNYTYSAKQQDEIKNIRQKYTPREEDKMEQLRKLDKSAGKRGTITSIIVGLVGALVFGFGMSCILVWTDYFIPGIAVGVVGLAGMALAYPLYNTITRKQREKLAPQILKLSDELMQQK